MVSVAGEDGLPQYGTTAGHAVGHPRCGSAGGLRGADAAHRPPFNHKGGLAIPLGE